ncbi:MAG: glycosyltransferase family 4 protein [Anaerolineae bacterium]|nr:glycosyltransferase family 4 protein [Anaerolineae bacterium]
MTPLNPSPHLLTDDAAQNKPPRRFRVLMVAPTSFFSDYGGHIRILEEAYTLQELNQELAIVTYYKGSDMPGLDVRRTAPLPYRTDYEVGSSRHKLAFDVYLAAKTIKEGLRFRPDVIHGHMHEGALIGGMLAKMLHVPLVFDFQGSLTAEMVDHHFLNKNGRFFAIAHRLERFITDWFPDAILTSSIHASEVLQQEFKIPQERIHALPDCANTTRFDPEKFSTEDKNQLKNQLGIPLDRTIIAYLGLMTDYQGVPHLIETAVRLKAAGEKAHFLMMGYPNVNHYQTIAQTRDVADIMTFTGKVEYRDAPLYLSLGDIAVAPKMSTTEGSGKVLNYMALAQPIVAYDSPVHREYLADLGTYAPLGDINAFTESIQSLLHNPAAQKKQGENLRKRVIEKYSWQHAGRQIIDIYTDLTA